MRSIEIPQPDERDRRYRALEILPAVLSLIILALPALLTLISLRVAVFFILAYLLFWFARIMGQNLRSIQGFRRMRLHKKLPWDKLNDDLEVLEPRSSNAPSWHGRNLKRVREYIPDQMRIKPSEVYHAVIIAFYNESGDVVEPTVQSVIDSEYDLKKMILILAYEERGGPDTKNLANQLIKKYSKCFYHAEAVQHPKNISGEVIGKGGNVTYAGRWLKKFIEEQKIDPLHVLVTTLDADNRPDKKYFGALTYTYCSTEEPKYSSYQPIEVYNNNIWDAPAPMRVIATGNTFWNLYFSERPHVLRNFSSHAQPLAGLIETDFWSVRTIIEDGHQYWRSYFRFDGHYDVYPISVPIYQDAVLAATLKRTLKMQFLQVRRWSWGCSDIAFVIYKGFLSQNHISKLRLIPRLGRLTEDHISRTTAPPLLLLAALIPFFFNQQTYITNQLPQIARWVQTLGTIGIIISIYLGLSILPPKPERYKRRRTFWMIAQWAYLIPSTFVFGASAAIDAQVRLAFGRYLGFQVTEKAVKKDQVTSAKRGVLRRILSKIVHRGASTP